MKPIEFEEYGIKFTDEDFEGVSKETLISCQEKIEEFIKESENEEE